MKNSLLVFKHCMVIALPRNENSFLQETLFSTGKLAISPIWPCTLVIVPGSPEILEGKGKKLEAASHLRGKI